MTRLRSSLGVYAPFRYGKGLPDRVRNPVGDVPVYGSNGIVGYHDTALTDGPAIIIGRKGTVGAVHISNRPCWPIDTTYYIADPEFEILRFKYYLLKSLGLEHMNQDSAVPGLNREAAHSIQLLLPPLAEQRAIAHILGSLDDKIDLNRRMNRTLEEIARALFRSWFVDFDPVHAHARGEAMPGLDPALDALFPAAFDDSPLGPIPAGWRVAGLDEIATYRNGLALQRFPPTSDAYLPVIKIRELRQGYADASSGQASTEIGDEFVIDDGDIVFSWSGSLLVDMWCGGKGALNQHLFKVTSTTFPKWFYYQWTQYHLPTFQQTAADKATTMGHIKRHHLTDAKVVVPPPSVIDAADELQGALLGAIQNNAVESRTLAALRDTLLPKLMSGELRVAAAAEIAEAAA